MFTAMLMTVFCQSNNHVASRQVEELQDLHKDHYHYLKMNKY